MKISFLVSLTIFLKKVEASCANEDALIRDQLYEKEVLVDNVDLSRNLVVDFDTHVLYFTNNTFVIGGSSSCYLDLDTKELGVITEVADGHAFAVDQVRHQVYIGGSDGIYKFHYNNKTVERVGADGVSIWWMMYTDRLYYLSSSGQVYTLKDGESVGVKYTEDGQATILAIDKDGDEFFYNSSGIFVKTNGSEGVDRYKSGTYLGAMTTDISGVTYSCYSSSLYVANKNKKTLEQVGDLRDSCFYLAFDKDNNMFFSTYGKIIKIKPKVLS